MTTPLFGKAVLTQNQMTAVAVVPATGISFGTVTVDILNGGAPDAKIRVAFGSGATPSPADYRENGAVVPGNGGTYKINCALVPPGTNIFVSADQIGVVAQVSGLMQETVA